MRVVDLFCGVGGATIGLQRAGLEVVAGVEKDAETAALYGEMTGVEAVVADVGDLRPGDLPPFDGVWASPPCQPYSGRVRLGSEDPRDGIGALLSFVENFRPRIVVVEEVPGFRNTCEHDLLLQSLYAWGYMPQERIVKALAFGVPQRRPRLIIVARRGREWRPFSWPGGVTRDLVKAWGWSRVVRWEEAEPRRLPRWITSRAIEITPLTLYHPQLSGQRGRRTLGVYPGHAPAPTVTASGIEHGMYAVDDKGRSYRLRERNAARFQALPWLEGLKAKHIGNAVPPPMAEGIGRVFKRWGTR